jgi:hypothetical protein
MIRWKTKGNVIRDECLDILERKKNLSVTKDFKELYDNIFKMLTMDDVCAETDGRHVNYDWFRKVILKK